MLIERRANTKVDGSSYNHTQVCGWCGSSRDDCVMCFDIQKPNKLKESVTVMLGAIGCFLFGASLMFIGGFSLGVIIAVIAKVIAGWL